MNLNFHCRLKEFCSAPEFKGVLGPDLVLLLMGPQCWRSHLERDLGASTSKGLWGLQHAFVVVLFMTSQAKTKRYCCDSQASQAPVLCLPVAFLDRLETPIPSTVRPNKETPALRRASWVQLAEMLANSPRLTDGHLRAIRYLCSIGAGEAPRVSL